MVLIFLHQVFNLLQVQSLGTLGPGERERRRERLGVPDPLSVSAPEAVYFCTRERVPKGSAGAPRNRQPGAPWFASTGGTHMGHTHVSGIPWVFLRGANCFPPQTSEVDAFWKTVATSKRGGMLDDANGGRVQNALSKSYSKNRLRYLLTAINRGIVHLVLQNVCRMFADCRDRT